MALHQETSSADLIKVVHDAYSAKARTGTDHAYANKVAQAFGYTREELQSIPSESHMGLSCGNPVAAASIKNGEVVLDLGSGGGIDVFLAAGKVGPNGKAIGLDMSADMISRARSNAEKRNLNPPSVSFIQTLLTEPLPIASNSVDCILSNCVVNLLPTDGKSAVLKEAYRILKPGGRIVLDDIVAKKPLPDELRQDLAAYVGCIAGAILIDEYRGLLSDAGFKDSLFVDTHGDINVYREAGTTSGCCAGPCKAPSKADATFDANIWVASYQIYAVKDSSAGLQEINAEPLLRWWDAFPVPKSTPPSITCDEVADMIRSLKKSTVDYAIIDVRRDDHAGGHVRGSFQFHAQTFYIIRAAFVERFRKTKQVIFYCGSSCGRAPRCAGWYQDYLNELGIGREESAAYVMEGGARGWLAGYGDNNELSAYD